MPLADKLKIRRGHREEATTVSRDASVARPHQRSDTMAV